MNDLAAGHKTATAMAYPARIDAWQSLPAMFFDKASELGDKPLSRRWRVP